MSKEDPNPEWQKLLEALRRGEEWAFEKLYRSCHRQISSLVRNNSGSEEDAKDIFQETLIVFLRKLRDPSFALTADVCTFLYAIARRLWLKRLSKKGRMKLTLDEEDAFRELPDPGEDEDKRAFEEKHRVMSTVFSQLSENCRLIIVRHRYQKIPLMDIAEELGLTYNAIRVKMHRCMTKFKKLISDRLADENL